MGPWEEVILALLVIGLAFNGLGTVALFRFPDVYTRLHGATKCTTFGSIFTGLAAVVYGLVLWGATADPKFGVLALHALLAVAALLVTNPNGAHAIARAAHRSGVLPQRAVVDRLAQDEEG
ncbi:MAG: monovalent cation/H(+) antiporter subunit G [Moorellales bacterium]